MKPFAGAFAVGGAGIAQIALAAAVSGVVGQYLTGEFNVDEFHTTGCGLSMRGSSICTAAYVSTVASILLSILMMAMQCATAEGRFGLGFCGPILSLVGFFWWLAYGAAATSAAVAAGGEDSAALAQYRTAVVALSWALMCLFITSFFLSAAAASSAARARTKLESSLVGAERAVEAVGARADPALAIKLKRFNQPQASPPVSPTKSSIRSYGSSVYDAFSESDSPKKWVQPYSKRHIAVTSDGLRTLLLVGGEPVPLSAATSPNLSPMASPMARSPLARSPLARDPTLTRVLHSASGPVDGSGGSGYGSFQHILLPPGLRHHSDAPPSDRSQA